MSCCQCQGIESLFSRRFVESELRRYRRKGPRKTTRLLCDALKREGVDGATLLDIGGGVGAISHELLTAGASASISVDASTASIEFAREEAARRRLDDRMQFTHGNFVDLSKTIAESDVVTLDRVICCYDDMRALVGESASHATRLYGVVYPRDTWWTKMFRPFLNLAMQAMRNPFRFFIHPSAEVEATIHRAGLSRRSFQLSFMWQVAVYVREAGSHASIHPPPPGI